jgi:DNA (cytosine-5)-methyltransferase 1
MPTLKPTVIDLFAGVGGLSLGAVRAGFDLKLAVELDKHALAAHTLNFPKFYHSDGDVAEYDGDRLLWDAGLLKGELTGLIGGPPCQGFSVIGHREVIDPRNDLFGKFFGLVAECRPKFFVAENVLGILDKQYDDIRDSALSRIPEDYTVLEPIRIKASDYGAPTIRERAFFIGYLHNEMEPITRKQIESAKVDTPTTVEQALFGLPVEIDSHWLTEAQSWRLVRDLPNSRFYNRVSGKRPGGVGDKEAVERHRMEAMVSGCFGTRHTPEVRDRYDRLVQGKQDEISKSVRLKPDGFCPTIRAGTAVDKGSFQAVRPIHPSQPRVITPREAARLQGFPDWFRFAPSKWHSFRQIGNSVSPIVAEAVLKAIRFNLT